MNLDEAIKYADEVAEEQKELYRICPASESEMLHCDGTKDCKTLKDGKNKGCLKCAEEHRQLAEWLKELKAYKEQGDDEELDFVPEHKKIPCTMIIGKSCGDAISRQATFNLMRGLTRWCVKSEDGKWKNVGLLYDDVMFGIDRLPSVTPKQKTDTEPETGRWIDDKCSVCGKGIENLIDSPEWYKNEEPNFCPFCGIKVEVEE